MLNENMTLSNYYQTIINSFAGQAPCGTSLEYDPAFLLIQSRLQPKLGAEYGDFVEAAEPINWSEIERDCRTLMLKSIDIRLVNILMRCRIRLDGATALADGLEALTALLLTYPDDLHPQLTDEGEFEPLMRANAVAELEDTDGFLMDVRNLVIPNALGLTVTLKEYEKALIGPRDENTLPETAIAALQQEWSEQENATINAFLRASAQLKQLQQLLENSLGDAAPDLGRLGQLVTLFDKCEAPANIPMPPDPEPVEPSVTPIEQNTYIPESQTDVQEPTVIHSNKPPSGINNRTVALARLREVRRWFEEVEPSSPAILLLAFAEKTAGKSFAELIRSIPMEMVSQLESDKE